MPDSRPPRTTWITFTPHVAQNYLDRNEHNRKIRDTVVKRYAQDMSAGDWMETGDPIRLDTTGKLLDGQHRLAAVVLAGQYRPEFSIRMLVIRGLDPKTQDVIDTGLKRTPADVLHLAGIKNSIQVSSTIRCLVRLETGRIFEGRGAQQVVTNSEMLHWLEEHPGVLRYMEAEAWKLRQTNIPPSPAAAALWTISQRDQFGAAEFLDRLVSLEGLEKGSPIAALARRVAHLRVNRSRLEQVEWMGMICQAWNAWAGQQQLTSVKERSWTAATFPWPKSPSEALEAAEQALRERESVG